MGLCYSKALISLVSLKDLMYSFGRIVVKLTKLIRLLIHVRSESTELVTAGNVSQSYSSMSSAEWEETSFSIPSSYLTDGFRMKFILYAGMYPNNLYLDDINITGTVGVEEAGADFYGAKLYPNPTEDGVTTLSYYNPGGAAMEITLTDMSGRLVEKWNPSNNVPGNRFVEISTTELPKGMYLVSLKSVEKH